MSAADHLNQQQFFHTSSQPFKRGDLILPRTDPRHPDHDPEFDPDDAEDLDDRNRSKVFMSTDAEHSSVYGTYTYRVAPTGEHREDERWRGSRWSHHPLQVRGLESNNEARYGYSRTLP